MYAFGSNNAAAITNIIRSGIAEHYTPEELVGKQVPVLINLEPKEIRGNLSQGMILMAVEEEMAWVSPPFENTGSLDVAPLGKELTTVFPIVNFVGYDINEISYLAESWLDDKWQALRRKFQEMRIKGDSRWDSLPEYAWLQNHDISPEYFTLRMEEPLTQFYGAARDDVLLAYVAVSGNSSFQVWDERASIRMNSFSPQEFLDLQVARLFVELGVPLFERGVALPFMAIEYKQKFGPLTVVEEWNYEFRGIAN